MRNDPQGNQVQPSLFKSEINIYQQRRDDTLLFLLGGSPAKSAAAWLSAIDKAERNNTPCPSWDELERIAPSIGAS